MSDYVRVSQVGTGHELSVPAAHYEANPEAYSVLKGKPATDVAGDPLPAKHKQTLPPAGSKSGQKADSQKEND